MVAVLCSWHEHHEPAARQIERRLGEGEMLVVAAPALVETYAVLTRLPPPHRLSPADSLALLEANFMVSGVEMVALDPDGYRRLLRGAPTEGIAGGRMYDAVIAACTLAAGVDTLLTFNERQFLSFAAHGLRVVVPT
jgi:predicted nucleic acid-binding protein